MDATSSSLGTVFGKAIAVWSGGRQDADVNVTTSRWRKSGPRFLSRAVGGRFEDHDRVVHGGGT